MLRVRCAGEGELAMDVAMELAMELAMRTKFTKDILPSGL